MKVKLSQVVGSQEALAKLIETKLPVKIGFKLGRLVVNLQPDLKIYEEQRLSLVKELGALDPELGPDQHRVTAENMPKFVEEITKLQDIEIDVKYSTENDLEKIKVSELGEVSIEPKELIALDWLLEA